MSATKSILAKVQDISPAQPSVSVTQMATRAPSATPGEWVDSPTAARIAGAFAMAQTLGVVSVVYGSPGVGKTEAARHYEQQDASVWYVAARRGNANVVPFLEDVCDAISARRANGAAALFRTIIARITNELPREGNHGLLIVDEAQHLTPESLEELRSIHDAAGVGLALLGSRDLYARFHGGKSVSALEGLRARVIRWEPIESNTPEDVAAFADAWGVTSAAGRKLLAEICMTEGGIRRATMAMRVAAMQAKAAHRTQTDADLREAWLMVRGAA